MPYAAMQLGTTMQRDAAVRDGTPPPPPGPAVTPAQVLQRAHAAFAANRVQHFRQVLTDTLTGMQEQARRLQVEQSRVAMTGARPDPAREAAAVAEMQPALAFMQAVSSLQYDDALRLHCAFGSAALTDEQRAVVDRSPALKAWQAKHEAEHAAQDRANAEHTARVLAERRAARPAELVAELRARGVTLAVDREGRITAQPGDGVTREEAEEIAEFKHEVVAILTAPKPVPASPAKPFVIA